MNREELVAQGQPYGERQKTVGLMRQGGIPTTAGGGRRPQGGGGVPPAAAGPAADDWLMARQPSYPQNYQPPDKYERLRNLAETSPNSFVRALLGRILGST